MIIVTEHLPRDFAITGVLIPWYLMITDCEIVCTLTSCVAFRIVYKYFIVRPYNVSTATDFFS